MSSTAKVPAEGVRIDGAPDGVIRIAVPANAEAVKVNARRRAIQAFGRGGIQAIGKVPTPRSAKVNGQACLVFDFTPVTVSSPAKAEAKAKAPKAKAEPVSPEVLAYLKANGLPLPGEAKAEAKAERTPGRWAGVACRTCRDFGFVKRTANSAGRVTYRSADGCAQSVEDGRGVPCPDHTQGSNAEAKATRKAVKAARATYRAQKAAAEAASA